MRTLEEIKSDTDKAFQFSDAEALLRLADELDNVGSPEAAAVSLHARGVSRGIKGDYATAFEKLNVAVSQYEKIDDRIGMARATSSIGMLHFGLGDITTALEYYRRSLDTFERIGDKGGVALVTINIGIMYGRTGDFPVALEHFERSLDIFVGLGDIASIAKTTGNIGRVYSLTGDYPAALEQFQKTLDICEELGDRDSAAKAIGSIGEVYAQTGSFAAALEYFQRARDMNEQLGGRSSVAHMKGLIGELYSTNGDFQPALEHYREALETYRELGEKSSIDEATLSIVSCLLNLNRRDEAAKLLDELDDMSMDDPHFESLNLATRARMFVLDEDFEAAQAKYMEALEVAVKAGIRLKQARLHEKLRDLAQLRNDLAAYVEHNNEYLRISEEINGKDAATKIAMQEKQREIDAERIETEKQLAVLHSTLPKHIADRVARGETVNDHHENASVIFLDIVGFTTISDKIPSGHVVHLLEQIFTTLDAVCEKHDVVKIKTIGDSYMAVSFDSPLNAAQAALEMLTSLESLSITMPPELGDTSWTQDVGDIQVRIGVHCGPVTAGVIGTQRMQYDVWGDTVNVASRMESNGEAGRVHCSEAFAASIPHPVTSGDSPLHFGEGAIRTVERGEVDIKGKGRMKTFWLESR